MRPIAPVLLALTFAGCLSATQPQGPALLEGLAPGVLPGVYRYACPENLAAQDAPCVARIEREHTEIEEPYIAYHPTNPLVFAVGVNYSPFFGETATAGSASEAPVCPMRLFATSDGGATWKESVVPLPREDATPADENAGVMCTFDPAFVYDDAGVIHFTGIGTGTRPNQVFGLAPEGERASFTFYTSTADAGASWSDPVILSDADSTDRNWVARDPANGKLYVVWQNTVGSAPEWTTQVAWSADEGQTWETQAASDRANCLTDGQPAVAAGELLYACQERKDGKIQILVNALRPDGKPEVRSRIDVEGFWPMLAHARGVTWMSFLDDPGSRLSRSLDGGRTWSTPLDVADFMESDDSAWTQAYWIAADPFGAFHLLVRVDTPEGELAPNPLVSGARDFRLDLSHVVLGPDGTVRQRTALASGKATEEQPRATAPFLEGDHYWGIAWSGTQGALAFTRDNGVEVALVIPQAK